MSTHIGASREDISNIVLMPGDPMRAKMIAEKYLTNAKVVNTIRGMYGFTGYFQNKRIFLYYKVLLLIQNTRFFSFLNHKVLPLDVGS